MMPKFIVEDDFWSLFPQAKIGTVICQGIDNAVRDVAFYEKLLREAEQEAHTFLDWEEFSSNPVILVWREAFQKFKTKKGARCSIEALLKRVKNGHSIGTINPLVDIYNSIYETRSDAFHLALNELAESVSRNLGGAVKVEVLDSHYKVMTILG